MDSRYIAAAIPLFFLMIGIELWVNRRRGDPKYRFHDSVTSLSCGVGQQVVDVLCKTLLGAGYVLVFEHLRLHTFGTDSVLAWVLITLGTDLCYYWYHRASHRINALWALHVVHHQSEEYNLSAALRQAWFGELASWVFYLPLALAGFPPAMFMLATTLNTLYQFWIHTRSIKSIGVGEWVLNTPSHHRVHHGIDPAYIDKNYAGIFIVWDRLFGTFEPEKEEPHYGTVKPLGSWNPAWANVADFVRIARLARASSGRREKLWAWFAPPEWQPASMGGPVTVSAVDRERYWKYETPGRKSVHGYVLVNFVLTAIGLLALLLFGDSMSLPAQLALSSVIVTGLAVWGGLFESKPWALSLEWARLVAAVGFVGWFARGAPVYVLWVGLSLVFAVAFGAWAAAVAE